MDEQRQTPKLSNDQIADQHASSPPPPPPQDWPESGDLHATLPLSPQEARGGTSRAIRLPGGRHLRVVVPAGASEGQIISLEGLGEPAFPGGPRGRLTLTLTMTPAEASGAEAVPTREKKPPKHGLRVLPSRALLLLGLVLLLALGSVGSVQLLSLRPRSSGTSASRTPAVHTPLATRTAHVTATSPTQVTPTTTPQAVAPPSAATATPARGNSYPPANAILTLNDPLRDNSHGYNWVESRSRCQFAGDGYHVTTAVPLYTTYCNAWATQFSNVAYEVHIRLVKGDAGGLVFRANGVSGTFYYFCIHPSGQYRLLLWSGPTTMAILAEGRSSSFHTGPEQSNLLAVVATGDELTVYVNHTAHAKVRDGTSRQGQIGVAASTDGHPPVEVVFSQAHVWTF
jgi:hypothetical protein